MSLFCANCNDYHNDMTIYDGNLLCHECFKAVKKMKEEIAIEDTIRKEVFKLE